MADENRILASRKTVRGFLPLPNSAALFPDLPERRHPVLRPELARIASNVKRLLQVTIHRS